MIPLPTTPLHVLFSSLFSWVEKIVGKGENAAFQHFFFFNPFPNDEFSTLPNWKSLQMTISYLVKMAESSEQEGQDGPGSLT